MARFPVIYRADAERVAALRALTPQFFSPMRCRYHYLAMARKNFHGYLQGQAVRLKKYLYVLRPLLAVLWLDKGLGQPPMRFADLAAGTLDDAALIDEINALLAIKMQAGEAEYSPRWPRIHAFIETELARADIDPAYRHSEGDVMALDRYLHETVMAAP